MSADARAARLDALFAEVARAHEAMRLAGFEPILAAADVLRATFDRGGTVLIFGNGGSAADAQHFAAELSGRYERERRGLPAIALTTDTSALTAIGNDYGFERVFARQVEAHGRPGDVAIGITTSGASANVLAALAQARTQGLRTIALTGRDGGPAGRAADVDVNVPLASAARVQEVQRTIIHAICELVESAL